MCWSEEVNYDSGSPIGVGLAALLRNAGFTLPRTCRTNASETYAF